MTRNARLTALVTGATSGIGRATALHLAGLGFHAVGTGRDECRLAELAETAARRRLPLEPVCLDVTDDATSADVCAKYAPDVLVNNAGCPVAGAVLDVDEGDVRHGFDTMVHGSVRLIRLCAPAMRERGWGRIVQISSVSGFVAFPLAGWYAAAKHALEAYTDAMAIELAGTGIDVAIVAPGGVRTAIWDRAREDFARRKGDEFQRAYEQSLDKVNRFERFFAPPERVANVIARAVTDSRPRSRYFVGPDAHALWFAARVAPTTTTKVLRRTAL